MIAPVPFPLAHEDDVVEAIVSAITPHTRLAMIDHITSPTALVLPIRRIVDEVQRRGVDVLIDGAHALGMVPLALDELGAAYYTANAHKWLCAPKGAAFLHVRRDRQHLIHPTTISHGFDPGGEGARFREEFDWAGTVDPTAWLCIPECIRFMAGLVPGGWDEVMRRNGDLARRGADDPVPSCLVPTRCATSGCWARWPRFRCRRRRRTAPRRRSPTRNWWAGFASAASSSGCSRGRMHRGG